MNTEVGKIAGLLKNTSEKKTPLQINLDRFGKKLSMIILLLCAVLFALQVLKGGAVADAFLFAVARGGGSGSTQFHCDNCAGVWNQKDGERRSNHTETAVCGRAGKCIGNLF